MKLQLKKYLGITPDVKPTMRNMEEVTKIQLMLVEYDEQTDVFVKEGKIRELFTLKRKAYEELREFIQKILKLEEGSDALERYDDLEENDAIELVVYIFRRLSGESDKEIKESLEQLKNEKK